MTDEMDSQDMNCGNDDEEIEELYFQFCEQVKESQIGVKVVRSNKNYKECVTTASEEIGQQQSNENYVNDSNLIFNENDILNVPIVFDFGDNNIFDKTVSDNILFSNEVGKETSVCQFINETTINDIEKNTDTSKITFSGETTINGIEKNTDTSKITLSGRVDPQYQTAINCNVAVESEMSPQNNTVDVDFPLTQETVTNPKIKGVNKRSKNKKLRMQGKPYIGFSKDKDSKKYLQNKEKSERKMGKSCNSENCKKVKGRSCNEITSLKRELIFHKFWNDMSWEQRRVYVCNHVKCIEPKRRYTKGESRRKFTLMYHLTADNKLYPVCKQMFLSTLALGEYSVLQWVRKSEEGMNNSDDMLQESRKKSFQENDERNEYLSKFFEALPKLPSHYARRDSTKLYLEQNITSISHLYRLYTEKCINESKLPLSRKKFVEVFEKKNLSLHQHKKDKCDMCSQFEVGNMSEEIWKDHIAKKNRARQEKDQDKCNANDSKKIVLTMDLQAVKVSPSLTASATFYKTKLCVHNFTVYNLHNHHTMCYWFSEIDSDLTVSTFTSCIVHYLQSFCMEAEEIIIFSDGCTYQNRNNIMANGLLDFARQTSKVVYQKFLEKGHTHMECDSVHAAIERKLKNREIHLPSDYLSVTKEARRKPFPYESKWMDFSDFKNYSEKKNHRYLSIRPGQEKVVDIKALMYSPDGTVKFKLNFESSWETLPQRQKQLNPDYFWPQLHTEKKKISSQKYQHLQQLKILLPKDCHGFYDTLPHE